MQLKKVNDEVFYCDSKFKQLNHKSFEFLLSRSSQNKRRRCRVCTHNEPNSNMHEMFIMHRHGNYVPIHKHLKSEESSLILKGEGALICYEDNGQVAEVIYLNSDVTKGCNYLRVPVGQYHSLYIESDVFYFKETIEGPFIRGNYQEANWTPQEADMKGVSDFIANSLRLYQQAKLHDGS
jgi:cupin fold WbuC family metalloprotein